MKKILSLCFGFLLSTSGFCQYKDYMPDINTNSLYNGDYFRDSEKKVKNILIERDSSSLDIMCYTSKYYKNYYLLKNSPYKLLTYYAIWGGYMGHLYYFYTFEVGEQVTSVVKNHIEELKTENLETKYKITHKDLIKIVKEKYEVDLVTDYVEKQIECYRIDKGEHPLYKSPFYVVIYTIDKKKGFPSTLIYDNVLDLQYLSYSDLSKAETLAKYIIINATTGEVEMDVEALQGYFNYLKAYQSQIDLQNRVEFHKKKGSKPSYGSE